MSDSSNQRDPVEELAAEFLQRCRRGESPSIEQYAERHPEMAEEIRELFPAALAMEGLKDRHEQSPGTTAARRPGQPERLGDFRIIREIGRGGMGVVYEAEQESLGRRVAIKVLRRTALLDETDVKRFEREARVAAGLHHTNIVQVFGVGEQDDYLYYVMQLIRGVGLDEVIARLRRGKSGEEAVTSSVKTETFATESLDLPEEAAGSEPAPRVAPPHRDGQFDRICSALSGPSRWQEVASVGLQVARALDYAHGQGAIHRDIKPSNLLLDEERTVWVADFGLAKAPHSEDLTLTGDLAGTLRYMAPEQFRGRADFRTDIYALGLTLYELLAGQPAYANRDRTSLIHHIMHGEPERPGKLNPDVPRDLETIVLKAISHEAGQRYRSAGEMAEDLERFREDRPITARRISQIERSWRWARRNPAVASLATSTLILLVLVAAVASAGYLRTREALRGEARERRRAEANAELAVGALDRIFDRLAPGTTGEVAELSTDDADEETITIPSPPVLTDETVALLEEMLTYYQRLATQVGDEAELRRKIAEANCRVGEIRRRLGQYEQAIQAYHRGLEIYAELLESAGPGTALRIRIAKVHNDLGQVRRLSQDPVSGRESHGRALDILEEVRTQAPDNREALFELARTHYLLARPGMPAPGPGPNGGRPGPALGRDPGGEDPPERRGGGRGHRNRRAGRGPERPPEQRPEAGPTSGEARGHLQAAVSILEDLTSSSPENPRHLRLLALCYRENARQLGRRDREASEQSLRKATRILEKLAEDYPEVPDYRYELAETYGLRPPPGRGPGIGRLAPDDDGLEKALEISEDLVSEHPRVPDYQALHARLLHRRAMTLSRSGRGREALDFLQEATEMQASLVEQFPDAVHYVVWLAMYRHRLAEIYRHRRQAEEALALLEETARKLSATLENHPEQRYLQRLQEHTHRVLARMYEEAGKDRQAEEAREKASEQEEGFRRWRRGRWRRAE